MAVSSAVRVATMPFGLEAPRPNTQSSIIRAEGQHYVFGSHLSAARSRIQDADFAKESAALTRNQILQQAGTAMLAQANSLPQNVLSLLRG